MGSTAADAPRLSVVLPAYNEEARLPATLAAWSEYLAAQPYRWELVVADDGSRDGTAAAADDFAAAHPGVRVVRLPQNRGKGGAVREGVLAARGDVILFADADLGIPAHFAAAALATIDAGADVATGERSLRTYASEERSITRLVAGLAVQISRRVLALTFVRDSQCGFKALRRGAAERDLLPGAHRLVRLRHRGALPRAAPGVPGASVPGQDGVSRRLDVRRAQAPAEVPRPTSPAFG